MKIKIIQTTLTTMDENRQVESVSTTESFVLEADFGKILKNITTGETIRSRVCVTKKNKIVNYVEIDDPTVPINKVLLD